jgi:molybdopterin/thiamine biosynthesis adenylyltransferase
MIATKDVAKFIALLDGKSNSEAILENMGNFSKESALSLINYLSTQHLITDVSLDKTISSRYLRQVPYFDDMVLDRTGQETQDILSKKSIVVLGCGSTGSAIAEILVRTGIKNLTLVDYKNITKKNIHRHIYATSQDIGKSKVRSLADFLNKISRDTIINIYHDIIIPTTDLSELIPQNTDLVINSCDEPYIGHTSLKIGRHLHARNIPLYVAGGFDAHLMSSGELISPPKTPCIDCAQKTFTNALGEWKPTYSTITPSIANNSTNFSDDQGTSDYIAGGPGGVAAMSGFSANLGSLRMIQFLVEDSTFDYTTKRHEYLINGGTMTDFEMQRQEGCSVCNN